MRENFDFSREAGYQLQFDEIENEAFLPAKCMEGSGRFLSIDDGIRRGFRKLEEAKSEGKILKICC